MSKLKLVAGLLSLAYIALLSSLALHAFNMVGFTTVEKTVAFLIQLTPALLVAICLLVAWRKELVGGILFLILALAFTLFFHTYRETGAFIIVTLPLIIIGGLFLLNGTINKK